MRQNNNETLFNDLQTTCCINFFPTLFQFKHAGIIKTHKFWRTKCLKLVAYQLESATEKTVQRKKNGAILGIYGEWEQRQK